jgi:hypothetical protein
VNGCGRRRTTGSPRRRRSDDYFSTPNGDLRYLQCLVFLSAQPSVRPLLFEAMRGRYEKRSGTETALDDRRESHIRARHYDEVRRLSQDRRSLEAAFGLSCVVLRGCMGRTVLPLCPSGLVGYEPQVRRRCNGSGGAIMSHWHPDLPFCALILFLIFLMFLPEMIEGVRKYRAGRDLAQRITAEHEAIKALEKRAR